jgi:hypothetical protein
MIIRVVKPAVLPLDGLKANNNAKAQEGLDTGKLCGSLK